MIHNLPAVKPTFLLQAVNGTRGFGKQIMAHITTIQGRLMGFVGKGNISEGPALQDSITKIPAIHIPFICETPGPHARQTCTKSRSPGNAIFCYISRRAAISNKTRSLALSIPRIFLFSSI